MRCPKCKQAELEPNGDCPQCGFHGDKDSLEELSHLKWLLDEMGKWGSLGFNFDGINRLRKLYTGRQSATELKLGLRLPSFTVQEAHTAWVELSHLEALADRMKIWYAAGQVKDDRLLQAQVGRFNELRQRLEGHLRPEIYITRRSRLADVNFIIETIPAFQQADVFTSPESEQKIKISLQAEKESLEVLLGMRTAPAEPSKPLSQSKPAAPVAPTVSTPRPPAAPAQPAGERLRRSLLSERTLQALIFLGIFLLFTAAISFVISGWNDFSKELRVGIPTGFTLIFILLGWYVRTKTTLYRSGIAISAIAALLFPIDAYTVYVNYIPANNWPEFWVIASLFSLLFYIMLTLLIQSRFFGYLVGIAGGSLILAAFKVSGLSLDWYGTGLSGLAMVMLFIAARIARGPAPERVRVFVDPFRYLGLWLPGILMPLTLGQWLVLHKFAYDELLNAMTVTWFLGGFIFAWGAIRYRSVALGSLAAAALPFAVAMGQGSFFHLHDIHTAWQAFGLACLTPLYFITAYWLSTKSIRPIDPVRLEHANTANVCGWMLVVITAFLALIDPGDSAPTAATHFVLAVSVALFAMLWKRPRMFYTASFFALTASSFFMTSLHFGFNQLGVGWDVLAIVHILLALLLARFERGKPFLSALVVCGYGIAAIAVWPALLLGDSNLLVYSLGDFIALALWGAALAYQQRPGFFVQAPVDGEKPSVLYKLLKTGAIFHWLAALSLPYWLLTVITNNRPADSILAFGLATLACGMVAISYWLRFTGDNQCRRPWRLIGLLVSVIAPLTAFIYAGSEYTPSIVVLVVGLLYFVDSFAARKSIGLYPAGLMTAWGLGLLLDHAHVDGDVLTFALCLLVGLYIVSGLLAERRKLALGTPRFLAPLYHTAHLIALFALMHIYLLPVAALLHGPAWTDQMQLWGAVDQLLLAGFYFLYTWGRANSGWAFVSLWLAVASGGFLIIVYSSGQGSLAAKAALIVIALILAERALVAFRYRASLRSRLRAYITILWWLYRQPLLMTGWLGSIAVIMLALIRNYLILGGGEVQQIWAAVALLLITALYALSARLFRQAHFVWFAVCLVFLPWTIFTHLDWFTPHVFTPAEYAISWMFLAWLYFFISLIVRRFAAKAYITPLTTAARLLTPFCLLWGIADAGVSRITVGMAVALYAVAAWEDHRQNRANANSAAFRVTKFLYPSILLVPLWGIYWLKFLQPAARAEHAGLLLLGFAALGLLGGQLLERLAPRPALMRAYGLPAYLAAYASLATGVLLTAHIPGLLAFALLYAAVLMVVSSVIFKSAIWVYPAAGLLALSLLTSLGQSFVPLERRGWWLIGLAAVYLTVGWLLRRLKRNDYASAIINVAFVLIPLGLPASSQDRIGAFWGYGGAALLYLVSAFWLKQPLLLAPACVLIVVPYASALRESPLDPRYYGLALFPGAIAALGIAQWLDARLGAWRDFPLDDPTQWFQALAQRLLGWWGLSFYMLGFGLASAAPFFTNGQALPSSLNFFLLAMIYAWAVFRFRVRLWLWASTLAVHLGAILLLRYFELGPPYNAEFWLNFMPVTLLTTLLALWVEKRFNEGSPFAPGKMLRGWSRPLYFFVFTDLLLGQLGGFQSTLPGTGVTLAHLLIIAVLASIWGAGIPAYISAFLGLIALFQWHFAEHLSINSLTGQMAGLALGYGALGFGYRLFLRWQSTGEEETQQPRWLSIWEIPLQRSAMLLTSVSLVIAPLIGINLVGWTIRAMFGMSFRDAVEPETVRMFVWTFALTGLVYAAAATVYRRLRLGYLAVGLLLVAWFLYAYYINIWASLRDAQWYAMPAGLYLLLVSYVEWTRGSKRFARWLDYAGLLLMMGSLFWQTLSLGLIFFLMLVVESLAIFGWGMTRRLRRFFYLGIAGVILAVLGQLVNGLQNNFLWLILGGIGLLLLTVLFVLERNLEAIKSWRQRVMETWD